MPVSLPTPRKLVALIVDDQAIVRDILKQFLAGKGFEVTAVESGEDAVQYCELMAPDIVLMDINMPGMGGLEAMKLVLQRRPSTIVIVLSSENDDQMAQAAIRSGARDYLTKPVLLSTVEKALSTHLLISPVKP